MKLLVLLSVFAVVFIAGCVGQVPITDIGPDTEPPDEEPTISDKVAPVDGAAPQFETVADGLEVPWQLDFSSDGRLFYTERAGRIGYVSEGNKFILATLPEVYQFGEGGLMGLALDPDFANNENIYICYTYLRGLFVRNRISRITESGGIQSEEFLLDDIPGGSIHNGCRLKFGPDGKLYATMGEAGNRFAAQDIETLHGTILRINSDGSIPSDNPFADSPIWSYGHRNPQGIAWSDDGTMYSSEHGQSANDEINVIVKGANYGWPEAECTSDGEFTDPVRCYGDYTLAPGGIAIRSNELYVTGLRGKQIRKLTLSLSVERRIIGEEIFLSGFGRIRDVIISNDGYLYFATSNRDGRGEPEEDDDRIVRVKI